MGSQQKQANQWFCHDPILDLGAGLLQGNSFTAPPLTIFIFLV
jgi:hypothetical protein